MIIIQYRIENKYLITDQEVALLFGRLKSSIAQDIHQENDCYEVRSLYFDDAWDLGVSQNEAGVDQREKFRVRIYNADPRVIRLERKEKQRGLVHKDACDLTRDECDCIMNGTYSLKIDERKLLNVLRLQMRCRNLQPKIVVQYERTAFVNVSGNVRITFDRNIGVSQYCSDFFEEKVRQVVPILPSGMHILEVKYDEFLPDHIADLLKTGNLRRTSFSKYYLGRCAFKGDILRNRSIGW